MSGIKKLDHVAIAVRSIAESRLTFESIYGAQYLGKRENIEQQYVVA
ncbi:hypothetical protein BH23CHL5_BH23CHL5_18360 [soil metagenome]